ncbi:MAG: hypothetical protein JJLCMIEE_02293 [Acidimicrobiales bacterium]|nr:MAG: VOC family protein [Actinomycetota bacterium]MBV6509225.1 hypothetical protein [Acidimicrobiales bacterium]RIK08433.1 MAG: glyoxalase [Acidobacteriota bacterium]
MEVLSSRVLLRPLDFERSLDFYVRQLGLSIYREYGYGGDVTGVVLFMGGGFLELSRSDGAAPTKAGEGMRLWLQVPDLQAEFGRLEAAGVAILEPPAAMPWGLEEMWIEDPDGNRVVLVEVPPAHPLRRRVD